MRVSQHFDHIEREQVVSVRFGEAEQSMIGRAVYDRAIDIAAQKIAEIFIEQHAQDVLAAVKPDAVATLVAAEAAASIREVIHKKFPDNVVTKREVWQRGIFGGMSKL